MVLILRPLANFAEETYKDAMVWKPRHTKDEDYLTNLNVRQSAKIHKAISVIMYKLEVSSQKNILNTK